MLTIQNLTKRYSDGTFALQGVDLTLPSGMIGLLGPNGAGKSTLMRTLAALQTPSSGSIQFQHIDVLAEPDKLRRVLGYLPQSFGVYRNMSCIALLEHIAILKGLSRAACKTQIPELLALTNLTAVAHRQVANFSGGMRQRFGIAQALLGDPQLLILDEPTAGLDPEERERLHDLLVTVSAQKLVLLSTHIVEDVEHLCHHAALLLSGKVVASDAMPALLAPLHNKIWQSTEKPQPSAAVVLNKSYHFGQPCYRLFADTPPPTATAVKPTLQDRYFLALQHGGTDVDM
ncbi:ABC transporter ATP-binding protein [Pseudoalteromonas fenneropenaei]|uniref:ABC transporter ATP-binding protein n=1 Tax=Pseudoalteromonas fenneropenaei TaxID=1737459 RepID=A0ABV7CEI3_9GAMM